MTIDTRLDIENEPETPPTQGTAKNRRLVVMGLAALLVACAAGGAYYVHSRPYESTDDAFLEGSVVGVSPRVPGQVIRVLIRVFALEWSNAG